MNDSETNTSGDDSSTDEIAYAYPDIDYGGEEFNILNTSTTWGFYTNLDFEEETGEALDDAVYNRNRFIEEKFNIKFNIEEVDTDSMSSHYRNAILAADDVYDAAFCRANVMSSFILENYLIDLGTISSFNFDEAWWDADVRKATLIGDSDSIYVAGCDISMYNLQGTETFYINENLLADLGGTAPYDIVREGKWTLDKLREYTKLGANLNGDASFAFDSNSSSTYGILGFQDIVVALVVGSDQNYCKVGDDNIPYLAAESEQFYNVAAKVAEILGTEGEYLYLNGSGDDHYEVQFKNGRSLLMFGQIKSASKFRDMDDSYGILPMPKYDENQDSYYCYRSGNTPLLSIPVTNNSPDRVGVIMDAMAYLSYRDVLPVFYNNTLSQKQLRNEDSLEMLEIIRDSRYLDIARIYAWSDKLYLSVETMLQAGNGNLASTVAAQKSTIEANIQKTLDLFNK
ncbi:MAG: extracellular solute-binding protein [Clostridiales bacterium]|nr:extracellular solute-binding protein [Clostridiales bacterium]